MSLLSCVVCDKECVLKRRPIAKELFGAPCDICKQTFCKNCAELTTTEADVMALCRRTLLFYCKKCKCSQKYIDRATENEELQVVVDDLRSTIGELQTEIMEKNNHINRLKRSSVSFCEEVTRTEQEYTREIEILTQKNNDLREQLNKNLELLNRSIKSFNDAETQTSGFLMNKQSQTVNITKTSSKAVQVHQIYQAHSTQTEEDEELRSLMEDNEQLREKLADLESMRSSLLTSIEVLEVENKF